MRRNIESYTRELGFDSRVASAVAAVMRYGARAGSAAGNGERLDNVMCVILNAKKEDVELV